MREGFGEQFIPEEPKQEDKNEKKAIENEYDKILSRRSALKKIGKFVGMAALGGIGVGEAANLLLRSEREPKTEAEKIFLGFPKMVPGVGRIEKMDAVGAKHVFIHFRQTHLMPNIDEKSSVDALLVGEEGLDRVNAIQKEIYNALEYLREVMGVKSVLSEGFDEKDVETTKQYLRKFHRDLVLHEVNNYLVSISGDNELLKIEEAYLVTIKKEAKRSGELPKSERDSIEEEIINLEEKIKSKRNELENIYQKYKYILGGDILHFIENNLYLLPAEDSKQLEEAHEEVKRHRKHGGSLQDKEILHDREEVVLSKVLEQEIFGVVAYGANHNFSNNISAWNEKNPDNQIALVTLTPETLVNKKNKKMA